MFEDKLEIIRKTTQLAFEREKNLNAVHAKHPNGITLGTPEADEVIVAEFTLGTDLKNYLASLDFETIKILQTIMYIGRDGVKNATPEELYSKKRSYLDGTWETKDIEINCMTGKSPLGSYLLKGCKLLDINL